MYNSLMISGALPSISFDLATWSYKDHKAKNNINKLKRRTTPAPSIIIETPG